MVRPAFKMGKKLKEARRFNKKARKGEEIIVDQSETSKVKSVSRIFENFSCYAFRGANASSFVLLRRSSSTWKV